MFRRMSKDSLFLPVLRPPQFLPGAQESRHHWELHNTQEQCPQCFLRGRKLHDLSHPFPSIKHVRAKLDGIDSVAYLQATAATTMLKQGRDPSPRVKQAFTDSVGTSRPRSLTESPRSSVKTSVRWDATAVAKYTAHAKIWSSLLPRTPRIGSERLSAILGLPSTKKSQE